MLRGFLLLMGLLLVSGFAWGDPNIGVFLKFCAYAPKGYPDATYTIQPVSADNWNTNYLGGWESPQTDVDAIVPVTLNDVTPVWDPSVKQTVIRKLTGGARSISTANPDGSHYQCSAGYFFQQDNKGGDQTQSQPTFQITYSSCALDPQVKSSCTSNFVLDVFDTSGNPIGNDPGTVYVAAGAGSLGDDPITKKQNRIVIVPSANNHNCNVNSYYVTMNTSSTGESNRMSSAYCPFSAAQSNYYSYKKPKSANNILTVCIRLDPTTPGSNDHEAGSPLSRR